MMIRLKLIQFQRSAKMFQHIKMTDGNFQDDHGVMWCPSDVLRLHRSVTRKKVCPSNLTVEVSSRPLKGGTKMTKGYHVNQWRIGERGQKFYLANPQMIRLCDLVVLHDKIWVRFV